MGANFFLGPKSRVSGLGAEFKKPAKMMIKMGDSIRLGR
jgi:hypothetical protein